MNVKHVVLLLAMGAGCTSQATRLTIQQYQRSEEHKQLAFNNTARIANEQMLLNLQQYADLHRSEPEKVKAAITATWHARDQLELARQQYQYGRALTMLTTGQYLYNQQGALNVWVESFSAQLGNATDAAKQADAATGINSVKDLIPQADKTSRPTTQPQGLTPIQEMLWQIYGKH